jgi:hypothetical protein
MDYTNDNMEQLARDVVDSWDMDTLVSMAVETLIMNYGLDKEAFEHDVDCMA